MKKIFILIITIVFLSCSKEPEKNTKEMPGDATHKMAMDGEKLATATGNILQFADIKLTTPVNWIEEPTTSDMRIIQYFLKEDKTINIVGFYFGNQPNMVAENIQRWKDEFSKVDISDEAKLAKGKATMVSITGTYRKKPFPMAQDFEEVPGYTTLASIVETNKGPFYFKMVGPSKIIKAETDHFKSFLDSYQEAK